MYLCMYVAMSENRFLRFLPFRLFLISHSMKCQNMMGRTIAFVRGGLKYFAPDLVDSFVENKNSDIEVICSDLYFIYFLSQ